MTNKYKKSVLRVLAQNNGEATKFDLATDMCYNKGCPRPRCTWSKEDGENCGHVLAAWFLLKRVENVFDGD